MTDTKLKFNTGRGYSPEGQIITAVLVSTAPCPLFGTPLHAVDFHDITRGIRGRVMVCDFTEASVLAAYDRGGYGPAHDYDDPAHDADMAELRREQLAADVGDDADGYFEEEDFVEENEWPVNRSYDRV